MELLMIPGPLGVCIWQRMQTLPDTSPQTPHGPGTPNQSFVCIWQRLPDTPQTLFPRGKGFRVYVFPLKPKPFGERRKGRMVWKMVPGPRGLWASLSYRRREGDDEERRVAREERGEGGKRGE